MACVCFQPQDPLEWSAWPGAYRPPLGRPYRGVCRADPSERYQPSAELLVSGCNIGYARRQCDRVPSGAPDAVRFSLADTGRVLWVIEQSHAPVASGIVTRGSKTGQGSLLDSQVEAYFRACEEAATAMG